MVQTAEQPAPLPSLNRLDIKVELNADSSLTDIVAERFDAGVRLGEQVEKDMVAVRIGPKAHMIVVAVPSCFEQRPPRSRRAI